jgi:hypothetical protein
VLNILRGFNERFQFMSQLVTWQKPFPSFADVCADLRLAELNMVPPAAPPSALVASSSSKAPAATCSCAFAPSSGCRGDPRLESPRRARPRRLARCFSRRLAVALHPQPVDRVHSYVAWVYPWWSARPTTSRRPTSVAAVGSGGRLYHPQAPGMHYQASHQVPPTAWSPWTPESLANAFSTVALTPPSSSWGFTLYQSIQ